MSFSEMAVWEEKTCKTFLGMRSYIAATFLLSCVKPAKICFRADKVINGPLEKCLLSWPQLFLILWGIGAFEMWFYIEYEAFVPSELPIQDYFFCVDAARGGAFLWSLESGAGACDQEKFAKKAGNMVNGADLIK